MTLNFPSCAILPMNSSEDDVVSSFRFGSSCGRGRNVVDGFGKPMRYNWDVGDSCGLGRDRDERGGSSEPNASDIVDLLPSDPFDMEGLSATVTALAGWFEEFGSSSEDSGTDEDGSTLVAGLNFFSNRAMVFESEPRIMAASERFNSAGMSDGWVEEKEFANVPRDAGFVSIWDLEEFLSFGDKDEGFVESPSEVSRECIESCSDGDGAAPHESLLFALGYLGVRDLLSAERVCKSMRSAVQNDPLLWRHIHIDQPLSEKITDSALLQLTMRAQGNLQCLSLVECSRITNDGLKRVLQCNPRLTKLSVPGCTRLSIEGIVTNIKDFKAQGVPGIKCLRIGGLYGITPNHFEELKFLLDAGNCQQPGAHKPQYFHNGHLSCDDERAIDIETCPRCQNLRLVYDCPVEACQGKQAAAQQCRACSFCIARCVQCGRCINDSEYMETFCLELLCSGCWNYLLQLQEKQDEKGACSKHTIFHQETRYHLRLYC